MWAVVFLSEQTLKKMKTEMAIRIKELRTRRGFSQEELSERTGLSLRTIQRIENGETEPRGDSLKRLAQAFDVAPDELVDWTVQEDRGFLLSLNLSSLSFLPFPLLGILVPLIIWISKKGKIQDVDKLAKEILNFQITWTMVLIFGYFCLIVAMVSKMRIFDNTFSSFLSSGLMINLIFLKIMYVYNFVFVLWNTYRINKGKDTRYFPKFHFVK
jgi:transcriptional regulator with XRE-family HTH domain